MRHVALSKSFVSARHFAAGVVLAAASAALAENHPTGVIAHNSKPGAAYTLYLDFAGFNFTGTWGSSGSSPGALAAANSVADGGVFTAAQQAQMDNVWARAAEKYVGLNINVTTVDPAVAAGQAGTDAARQAYYDTQAKTMHTIVTSTIGTTNAFVNGRGGVSYVGVTQNTYNPAGINGGAGSGWHTNFDFTDQLANQGTGVLSSYSLKLIGECAGHENGHGLRLNHQSAYNGTTKTAEYSDNGASATVSPIMGNSYNAARGVWRTGPNTSSSTTIQNDIQNLLLNTGIGSYTDDNVGHSTAGATGLSFGAGNAIATTASGGYVSPVGSAPNAIGEGNYTTDFYKFFTTGGALNVTINESGQRLNAGVADPGGMLDSTFRLLDANGNVVTSVSNASSQASALSTTLAAGNYYLQVASAGGKTSTGTEAASYFDMGSYFLSGTVGQSATAIYYTGLINTQLDSAVGGLTNFSAASNGSTLSATLPGSSSDVIFGATGNVNTANFTTTLGGALSVNSLTFGVGANGATPVTINGAGTITINASNVGYTANTGIYVATGAPANTINANVTLAASQRWINNAASTLTVGGGIGLGASTLTLTGTGPQALGGAITGSGGVTSTSSGVVRLGGVNTYTGRTKIDNAAGVLRIAQGGAAVNVLGNAGGADIANGTMAFEYTGASPVNGFRLQLAASRNALTTPAVMDSGQIFSSTATLARGLGYRDDGTAILIKPALFGDADLDGGVSINDFNALAGNFGIAANRFWTSGDFDYDGGVSINDFNLLAGNFGSSLPAASDAWAGLLAFAAAHDDLAAFEAVTGVPEPATLGTLAVLVGLVGRRRRA